MPNEIYDVEAHNLAVKTWFEETLQQVKNRYMQLIRGAGRSGDGFESIKMTTRKTFGEIDRGKIGFERYLIFVHKGAGKGHGGTKGSSWLGADGTRKSTNPLSLGKMNTGTRLAEEWLNPVMDEQVPKLADIVADLKAGQVIKAIQIK